MSDNLTVVKNKKETVQEEKKILREMKPKLEKFLIDQQVNKASETAHKTHEEKLKTIEEMEKFHADEQAAKIAMHTFFDLKLWEKYPPPLEFAWLTGVRISDGQRLSELELKFEIANDIAGFSSYLVREWINMRDEIKKGTYRDPLSENEDNILWFWQKFCLDMSILIKSDIKYRDSGNQGLLAPNGKVN